MKYGLLIACVAAAVGTSAQAVVIGTDTFSYANGDLSGNASTADGWAFDTLSNHNLTGSNTNNVAKVGLGVWANDWQGSGATQVVNGTAQTQENTAKRYLGSDWRYAPYDGKGKLFMAVDLTYAPGASWMGLSPLDYSAEPAKFAANDQNGSKYFCLEINGSPTTWSNVQAIANTTYRIVGEIDLDNKTASMWVNPGAGDVLSPLITTAYNPGNWIASVRIGSGGTAPTAWDNLAVGTSFSDVVPEPASIGIAAGMLCLLASRRRHV